MSADQRSTDGRTPTGSGGSTSPASSRLLARTHGGIGHLTLNRPAAVNALDHPMVVGLQAALDTWRSDTAVRAILLDGAGQQGLCAGRDARAVYEDSRAGAGHALEFLRDEYRLAATIARYPKPVVVLMSGLVMGSGVGIAAHASHRVVDETAVIAMPEIALGLSPDVGSNRLFSRAPGELGAHLALTGDRMDEAGAIYAGFADHFVPRDRQTELLSALARVDADTAIAGLAVPLDDSAELQSVRPWMDTCYAADSAEEIVDRLIVTGLDAAQEAAARIRGLSPTAVKVALRALREARDDDVLEDTLERDLRVSARHLTGHDYIEGLRAHVADRDHSPNWEPRTLSDVSAHDVDSYFASLEHAELTLPR